MERVATLVAKNLCHRASFLHTIHYQLCRLAMHAAVAAQSYQTRVLTQLVYTSTAFETFRALGRPGCFWGKHECAQCFQHFSTQGQAADSNMAGTRGGKLDGHYHHSRIIHWTDWVFGYPYARDSLDQFFGAAVKILQLLARLPAQPLLNSRRLNPG